MLFLIPINLQKGIRREQVAILDTCQKAFGLYNLHHQWQCNILQYIHVYWTVYIAIYTYSAIYSAMHCFKVGLQWNMRVLKFSNWLCLIALILMQINLTASHLNAFRWLGQKFCFQTSQPMMNRYCIRKTVAWLLAFPRVGSTDSLPSLYLSEILLAAYIWECPHFYCYKSGEGRPSPELLFNVPWCGGQGCFCAG